MEYKVSIVIPAYMQEEYLADAIDSALHQTIPCEVIVINDGSTDNTKEIAESYKREHKITVVHQVNKGLAAARNAGIMNATGNIILPLDSDDMLYETCVEKMIETFKETGADVVAPSIKCFGIGNDEIIIMREPTVGDFRVGNRIPYCSAIKKECLLETGGYQTRLPAYEDYALWFDLLSRGKKIIGIQEPLVLYRTKTISMWKEAVKPENHVKLMEQIYKDFPAIWPKK